MGAKGGVKEPPTPSSEESRFCAHSSRRERERVKPALRAIMGGHARGDGGGGLHNEAGRRPREREREAPKAQIFCNPPPRALSQEDEIV